MDNSRYGGFVVSKNVLNGKAIRYTYREKSNIQQLNGWHVLSEVDTDEYVNSPSNFMIVGASTIGEIAPVLLVIFNAPYGTDLFWKYKEGVLVGFYDLKKEKDVTIQEIMHSI